MRRGPACPTVARPCQQHRVRSPGASLPAVRAGRLVVRPARVPAAVRPNGCARPVAPRQVSIGQVSANVPGCSPGRCTPSGRAGRRRRPTAARHPVPVHAPATHRRTPLTRGTTRIPLRRGRLGAWPETVRRPAVRGRSRPRSSARLRGRDGHRRRSRRTPANGNARGLTRSTRFRSARSVDPPPFDPPLRPAPPDRLRPHPVNRRRGAAGGPVPDRRQTPDRSCP